MSASDKVHAQSNPPVITIDGPSGSGKGTIAQRIASKLGFHLLDSGALYRLLGLQILQQGLSLAKLSEQELEQHAQRMPAEFHTNTQGDIDIVLDNQLVNDQLRTEKAGEMASQLAAMPAVRRGLLQRQRDFCQPPGLVADGRDMGTVVFPGAILKIYLDASPEARAQRRRKQLIKKGGNVSISILLQDLRRRDLRDRNRKHAPLMPANDAVIIDSTDLGVADVVSMVMELATKRLSGDINIDG